MGASYIGGCIFGFGDQCSILKTKKCKGCKFKKTAAEWDEGQQKAKEILKSKGLEVCEGVDLNGDRIITTRPITETPTRR